MMKMKASVRCRRKIGSKGTSLVPGVAGISSTDA